MAAEEKGIREGVYPVSKSIFIIDNSRRAGRGHLASFLRSGYAFDFWLMDSEVMGRFKMAVKSSVLKRDFLTTD